jgi:hypothetical protein
LKITIEIWSKWKLPVFYYAMTGPAGRGQSAHRVVLGQLAGDDVDGFGTADVLRTVFAAPSRGQDPPRAWRS